MSSRALFRLRAAATNAAWRCCRTATILAVVVATVCGAGCDRAETSAPSSTAPAQAAPQHRSAPSLPAANRHSAPIARAAAAPCYRATWAVVIGIDAYPGGETDLIPLQFAVNDAREFAELLQAEFGYERDRVKYLSDAEATRTSIRDAFVDWLPSQRPKPDDAVLVFFAGHGLIDPASDAGYLAAVDSHGRRLDSCIPVADIRSWLAELPCRHKVVILDSCYSGSLFLADALSVRGQTPPATRSAATAARSDSTRTIPVAGDVGRKLVRVEEGFSTTAGHDNLAVYLREPAFYGLSAGRDTPVADGQGEQRHSIFTSALLRTLRERADTPREDHLFTFSRLAAQVESYVASSRSSFQVPKFGRLAAGDGDFVFRPTVRRQTPRELSEERRRTAHQRLVGIQLQNGARHIAAADFLGALPWFTEVLAIDHDDPERDRIHRLRLKLLTEQAPQLRHEWRHRGSVNHIAFSPDGKRVVTCSDDFTACIWDAATGQAAAPTLQHDDPVLFAAFSPDGSKLITTTGDRSGRRGPGDARIWEVATGRQIGEPLRHQPQKPRVKGQPTPATDYVIRNVGLIVHAAFRPDGQRVVTAGDDYSAHVWDTGTGKRGESFFIHSDAIKAVAYTPDGSFVLTGSEDETLRFWNDEDQSPAGPQIRAGAAVRTVAFSPDGQYYAAATSHGVRLWRGADDRLLQEFQDGNRHYDYSFTFSPDSRRLAVIRADETVRVWDLEEMDWLGGAMHHPLLKRVKFSPDGQQLLAAGLGFRLFDVHTARPDTPIVQRGRGVADFSSDGRHVAVADGNTVTMWDMARSGPLLASPSDGQDWRLADVHPDGSLLALKAEGDLPRVQLWALATGQPRGDAVPLDAPVIWCQFHPTFPQLLIAESDEGDGVGSIVAIDASKPAEAMVRRLRLPAAVTCAAPVGSGNRIVVGTADGTVLSIDTQGLRALGVSWQMDGPIRAVAASPDGRWIVAATGDDGAPNFTFNPQVRSKLSVIDTQDGAGPQFVEQAGLVQELRLAGGSTLLAFANRSVDGGAVFEHFAQLWNLTTRTSRGAPREVLPPSGNLGRYSAALVPPRLAIDQQIQDLETGQTLAQLPMPIVWQSADGKQLIMGSTQSDGTTEQAAHLRAVDLESGQTRSAAIKMPGQLAAAALSPDGRLVAVAVRPPHAARSGERLVHVQLFDAESGELVSPPLPLCECDLHRLAFTADGGRLIVVGGAYPGVLSWSVSLTAEPRATDEWIAHAQRQSGFRLDAGGGYIPVSKDQALQQPIDETSRSSSFAALPSASGLFYRRKAERAETAYDWRAAAWNWRRHVDADPSDLHALRRLAAAHLRAEEWSAALPLFDRLLQNSPADVALLLYRAETLAGLKRWQEAEAAFAKGLVIVPEETDARLGRFVALAELARTEEARAALHDVADEFGTPLIEHILGECLFRCEERRDLQATILLAERLLKEQFLTGMTIQPYDRGVDTTSVQAIRATALLELGRFEESLAHWNEVLVTWPDAALYFARRAAAHAGAGKPDDAERDIRQAIQLGLDEQQAWQPVEAATTRLLQGDAAPGWAWRLRGEARLRQRQFPLAVADFERARQQLPDDPAAWLGLARAHLHGGEHERAIAELSAYVQAHPDETQGWRNRALALGRLDRWPEAVQDLVRITELRPQSASAWVDLGAARLHTGKWDDAAGAFTKAIDLGTLDAKAWMGRGNARAEQANWEAAARDFDLARAIDPADARLWQLRAIVALAAGDETEFQRRCVSMLEYFGEGNDADTRWRLAWTAGLVAAERFDRDALLATARVAVQSDAEDHDFLLTMGISLYRFYQVPSEDAENIFERLLSSENDVVAAAALALKSLCQVKRGDAAARQTLAEAEKRAGALLEAKDRPRADWDQRVALATLIAEARAGVSTLPTGAAPLKPQ